MPDSIPEERCVDSKDLNSDIYRMYLCVGKASPFVILIAGAILLAVLIYALHKVSVKKYGFEKDTMKELLKQEA